MNTYLKENTDRIINEVNTFFETASCQGFDYRKGQVEMAGDVVSAIINKTPLAVEAEVGIGKSYAYLVPVMKAYSMNHRQVVIATSTIALQEQLYKDAMELKKRLHFSGDIIIAKGMGNYLCRRNVECLLKSKKNDEKLCLLQYCCQTGRQDRSEIPRRIKESLWENVRVSRYNMKNCSECKYAGKCKYNLIRRKMCYGNDIVIANQNMLISSLMNSENGFGIFNNSANTFVIDEAHNLECNMRNALTQRLYKQSVNDLLNSVMNSLRRLNRSSTISAGKRLYHNVNSASILFFRSIGELIKIQATENEEATSYFFESSKDMNIKLGKFINSINNFADFLFAKGLHSDAERLFSLRDKLRIVKKNEPATLIWLECDKGETICFCRKDIRQTISRLLFSGGKTTILTSATISNSSTGTPEEKCAYYLNSIGFSSRGSVSVPKKSPFDYEKHARLYCSDALPYPSYDEKDKYREASIREIVKLLNVTHGKSLILFTSKNDMEYVYKKLSNMGLPYKILMQNENSSQAIKLNVFSQDTDSVMLGTGAYWEGINVAGLSLSQVIIFKLPFPVPDPIIQSKMDVCNDPVYDVCVPEMVIKLKQGCGRLIRSSSDIGIVSILDPRMSRTSDKKYRSIAKSALSVKNEVDSIGELIEFWNEVGGENTNDKTRAS